MAVAVDDPRHHEFAGEIDHGGARPAPRPRRRADVADAAVLDHDRDIGLRRRAAAVDERGAGERGDWYGPWAAALVENATAAVDNDTAAARAGRELARMMAFRCSEG